MLHGRRVPATSGIQEKRKRLARDAPAELKAKQLFPGRLVHVLSNHVRDWGQFEIERHETVVEWSEKRGRVCRRCMSAQC